MMHIQGYDVIEQIFHQNSLTLYRAQRHSDKRILLLKSASDQLLKNDGIGLLENEFSISNRIITPGLLKPIRLNVIEGGMVIEYPDLNVRTLSHAINHARPSTPQLLFLIRSLIFALNQLHQSGIVLGRLSPSSILFNDLSGEIYFTDLSAAAVKGRRAPQTAPLEPSELLCFYSPHASTQQRRLQNELRPSDDVFCLGQLVFWLATGTAPFRFEDYQAWAIGDELPLLPLAVAEERVPESLALFIEKMIHPHEQHRFKNFTEVRRAFDLCCGQLFNIDAKDSGAAVIQGFDFREFEGGNLFGQEKVWAALQQSYQRFAKSEMGDSITVLTGASGCGKSALLTKFERWAEFHRIRYISLGAGDNVGSSLSLMLSFINQLQAIVEQDSNQSESSQDWSECQRAICQLYRGLHHLDTPPSSLLKNSQSATKPVMEESASLMSPLSTVIETVIAAHGSLLLTIDNLDSYGDDLVPLMTLILPYVKSKQLFFVGAASSALRNEAEALIACIESESVFIHGLALAELDTPAIENLIVNKLCDPVVSAPVLAQLLKKKTAGNPLALRLSLHHLLTQDVLTRHPFQSLWYWSRDSFDAIESLDTETVIQGIESQLSQASISMLRFAACIGEQFETRMLADLSGFSPSVLGIMLKSAVSSGCLLRCSDNTDSDVAQYRFVHRAVHQHFHEQLPQQESAYLHHRIGRYLMRMLLREQSAVTGNHSLLQQLPTLLWHYRCARSVLAGDYFERKSVANFALQAAFSAQQFGLVEQVENYLHEAVLLLGEDAWQQDYRYCLAINLELLKHYCLQSDEESLEAIYQYIVQHARSDNTILQALIMRFEYATAATDKTYLIDLALSQLNRLGISIPVQIEQESVYRQLKALRNSENINSADFWLEQAVQQSKTPLARLLDLLIEPVAEIDRYLALFLSLKQIEHASEQGVTIYLTKSLAHYGVLLGDVLGEYQLAMQLGNVAMALQQKLGESDAASSYIVGSQIATWHEADLNEHLDKLIVATETETASVWHAYTLLTRLYMQFFTGASLHQTWADSEQLLSNNSLIETNLMSPVTALREIMHACDSELHFAAQHTSLLNAPEAIAQQTNPFARKLLAFCQLMHAFLTDDYDSDVLQLEWDQDDLLLKGHVLTPYFIFFTSLYTSRCSQNLVGSAEFYLLQSRMQLNTAKFEQWAYQNSAVFSPMYHVLQAECGAIAGNIEEALDHYYDAINQLKQSEQTTLLLGLSCEQLASFCSQQEHARISYYFLREAQQYYADWGADALAAAIQLEAEVCQSKANVELLPAITKTDSESANTTADIAVSAHFDDLVARVAWQTKAERVVLLNVLDDGGFDRVASYNMHDKVQSESIDNSLPYALLKMVSHSESGFLLDGKKSQFICYLDNYLRDVMPRSILVVPVIQADAENGKLVFYLEHRHERGLFVREHMEFIRLQANQLDMSQQVGLLQDQLTTSERIFSECLDNAGQGIVVHREGRILFANRSFSRLLGVDTLDELIDSEAYAPLLVAPAQQTLSLHEAPAVVSEFERTYQDVNGDNKVLRFSERAIAWYDGAAVMSTVENVTDLLLVEEKIAHITTHDALTNLPNRGLFEQHLQHLLDADDSRHKQGVVIYLDVDDFKEINHSLGHEVGDKFLIFMADSLVRAVKAKDIVSRVNGDRFCIVLNDVGSLEHASSVAMRLIAALKGPHLVNDNALTTSISLGISVFPEDSQSAEKLIRYAELAMYHAKRSGRNLFRFYQEQMNRDIKQRQTMAADLQEALMTRDLSLHYQPKIDIFSGKVVGVESLLRWPTHPGIGPSEFVPLAESNGFIIPMGDWVIKNACEQIVLWNNQIPVAVNLSAVQLRQSHLVDKVKQILLETGARPELLEFEITESAVMHNVDAAIAIMKDLHQLGVSLSIDDFGSGYSSLSYLKQFPVQTVKVDRSFVNDLESDQESGAIAKAIIDLGHTLGMKVIAEGVETDAQHAYLKACGCDMVQGYLYSKPLPVEKFNRWYDDCGGVAS